MPRTQRLHVLAAAIVIVVAACSTPPASSSHSPSAIGTPSRSPASSPSVAPTSSSSPVGTATPSVAPTAKPAASPEPSGAAIHTWSSQNVVRAGEDCDRFSATIDATGRTHAVVLCDGGIRYLTSVDRVAWQEHDFVPAIDTIETDPQVTTDGGRVYVAFTRLAPEDGGCGDDGLRDLGVFVQSKPLAGGDWSDPAKLGAQADHLQSFRVADGTLYATVTADDGGAPFFVSSGPGGAVRIPIPKAVATSLRIGDDGRARIAFVTEHAIRYGVVDGERLSATTIAHEDSIFFRSPSLVLGPGGTAGALWTETSDGGGGCASPGPGPLDGQYVATKDAAGWHIKRLTKGDGMAAMTMDADTGVVTVAVGAYVEGGPRVTLFSNEGGTWHRSSVAAAKGLYPAVLRHDPTTGDLVLFGANSDGISVVTRS